MNIKKILRAVLCFFLVLIFPAQGFAADNYTEYDYVPVLMYHHIVGINVKAGDSTVISESQLEEQIKTLLGAGYKFISLYDLYNLKVNRDWNNKKMNNKEKYVCLTFDDGYESNYEYLYPLLKKYGIKADVSVITSRCYDSYVPNKGENPKMDWGTLNEMAQSGLVQVYNHSLDHEKFNVNHGWEFIQKALKAEDQLNWNLTVKRKIHVFTYPNGFTTPWMQKQLKKYGFDMQLTTESKVVCGTTPLYGVPRITVSSGEDGQQLIKEIKKAAARTFN
jgi:peptidoglycan/xylan/chitin deacetylase (PgdA/CDA1 family)